MSIQKEFVLRYRVDGHVRFQIPAQVCNVDAAKAVTDGISKIDGVYRAKLYRGQQKLSIRFDEAVCDFKSLARQLFQLLADLEKNGDLNPKPVSKSMLWKEKVKSKLDGFKATRWAKEKFGDAKETVQAAKIITKMGMKKPAAFMKDPEKAIIDFLNDILVIFLIRLHWNNITQHWLVRPFAHRYEWMALFYMFFLLVRSRRQK
ncbi:MAG: hypothetical protein M0R41_16435 [Methylobacter tundripaludum]|uniref:Uncharacterized protein n=1 Tax=Methylobacter tundripaludum TaxID=173365 RepID=A0A2S6GW15_9GAMM|nr:hypothetical protein [Methylobacter tundripaludum]MCK9637860.1 hypothetical protein [Methylobacter tundripaludum]PPK69370.1 hypothetical protein B0F88_110156 [Methylobacter tundripaludum]